ncbi:hypothetical protein VaNZ11_009630, partial [Volvox africanus]
SGLGMGFNVRNLMAIGLSESYRLKNLNPGHFLHSAVWFTPNTLPVVGIDVVAAQDILFALRAADSQGRNVADVWLRALQLAQLAHDRLLRDLHDVDRNLSFWQSQVSAGGVWSHGAFMLFSRGPLSFAEDVAGAVKDLATQRLAPLMTPLLRTFTFAPPDQQQSLQPQGALKAGAEGAQASSSSSPSTGPAHGSASATDKMQHRVLLLRGLRLRLARALALLTRAAGLLRVDDLLAALQPREIPSAAATSTTAVSPRRALNLSLAGFTAAAVEAGRLPMSPSWRRHQEHEDPALRRTLPRVPPRVSGFCGFGQAVEDAVRSAVHGMRVAIEELLTDAGINPDDSQHQRQQQQQQQQEEQSGDERSLSMELLQLSDLLRLRLPAVHGLGLPSEPERRRPAAAWAASFVTRAAAPPTTAAAVELTSGDVAGTSVKDRPMGLHLTTGGGSAAAALGAARRAAALAGPLVPLPATARMPSRFQRHWLRYSVVAALLLYGGIFLVRHSRLAGSEDLDSWIKTAVSAVHSALRTHVAEPLAAVRDELFHTFRDRPAIVSPQDFSLSRESLLRMLTDFSADHQKHSAITTTTSPFSSSTTIASGSVASPVWSANGETATSSNSISSQQRSSPSQSQPQRSPISGMAVDASPMRGAGAAAADGGHGAGGGGDSTTEEEDATLAAGMAMLMRSYEAELRNPLRNLLLGDLARALLIQVQHLKVDGEAAMLRLDQILRANELSLSLIAALPAMGISLALAVGLTRLLIPRAPDPKRAAVPSRLAMASLEVDLAQLAVAEEHPQQTEIADAVAATAALEELRGLVVYRIHRVYSDVTSLYATADRTSRYSDWRQLYADLLRLAAPVTPLERLATHQRMMRTYSVFQR